MNKKQALAVTNGASSDEKYAGAALAGQGFDIIDVARLLIARRAFKAGYYNEDAVWVPLEVPLPKGTGLLYSMFEQ